MSLLWRRSGVTYSTNSRFISCRVFSPLGLHVLSAPTAAGYLQTSANSVQLCIPLPALRRIYSTTLDCLCHWNKHFTPRGKKTANLKCNAEKWQSTNLFRSRRTLLNTIRMAVLILIITVLLFVWIKIRNVSWIWESITFLKRVLQKNTSNVITS